jgi:hypothetical protein
MVGGRWVLVMGSRVRRIRTRPPQKLPDMKNKCFVGVQWHSTARGLRATGAGRRGTVALKPVLCVPTAPNSGRLCQAHLTVRQGTPRSLSLLSGVPPQPIHRLCPLQPQGTFSILSMSRRPRARFQPTAQPTSCIAQTPAGRDSLHLTQWTAVPRRWTRDAHRQT